MKSNFSSLVDLAKEVEKNEAIKNDYVVPKEKIVMNMQGDELMIVGDNSHDAYNLTNHAHGQLASKLKIPKQYYDRIKDIDDLRAKNVNSLLQSSTDNQKFMLRTLGDKARAVVSDKFKPFDNYQILSSLLPVLQERGDLDVMSQSLTEKKMYLQFKLPSLEGEVKKGDVVQAGMVITNSEVGAGAVDVKSMIWRLVCTNGLITSSVLRRYHVGRRIDNADDNYRIFGNDTLLAETQAFKLKLRDVVKEALSETYFNNQLMLMREASEIKIENTPKTVENVTKRFNMTEQDTEGVLSHMIEEGHSNNKWGLVNGITALAQSLEDKDRSYEYEKIGGQVLNLTSSEWKLLAS